MTQYASGCHCSDCKEMRLDYARWMNARLASYVESLVELPKDAWFVLSPIESQYFWRCEHHPSAIANFFEGTKKCEHNCHMTTLRWHDNGNHQPPSLNRTMRGSKQWSEINL